jgi:hypothetical protein
MLEHGLQKLELAGLQVQAGAREGGAELGAADLAHVQAIAVGEEFGEVQPAGARLLERNG